MIHAQTSVQILQFIGKKKGEKVQLFVNGDVACAEAAIKVGCRFFGGYPITPATEVAERMALRLPQVGGNYVQMEDEIASITAVLGASWAGVKSMTATSGPGFSLMQEGIGLAAMTETPCVIVDVQRAGPSTGMPTLIGQGDVIQARHGSHGDYGMIALTPSNTQEMFDLTIRAFNLSERFRTPVILLADEVCGHITSKVSIPESVEVINRKKPKIGEDYLPFRADDDLVPKMACAGDGYRVHISGLTHDEKGYPRTTSLQVQDDLIKRLINKIWNQRDEIIEIETAYIDDARIGVFAYGSEAGSALRTVKLAREKGMKACLIRPKTLWPFDDEKMIELTKDLDGLIVDELNMGQMYYEVKRCFKNAELLPGGGGALHKPAETLKKMEGI